MEITLQLESADKLLELFGPADSHLRLIRDALDVRLTARQNNLLIAGKAVDVNHAAEVIDKMQKHLLKRGTLFADDVNNFLSDVTGPAAPQSAEAIGVYSHKKIIEPSTKGQLKYVETMLANDLTFCIGPAGTGKTYLAHARRKSAFRGIS